MLSQINIQIVKRRSTDKIDLVRLNKQILSAFKSRTFELEFHQFTAPTTFPNLFSSKRNSHKKTKESFN